MCTALTYKTNDFYFGRTLDYEHGFSEEVTVTPRNFPLHFRHLPPLMKHHAIIGMAKVAQGYPLYFDAVNERGLAMAGLNFMGNAVYQKPAPRQQNVAQFEFIPWILAQCDCVAQARQLLAQVQVTDTPFSADLPPAQLHWLLADRQEAVTVEAVAEGLRIYDNPVGALTNNPPFSFQMFQLNNLMGLSRQSIENRFSPSLTLQAYSRGMGAMGLPGDWSSQSRFLRTAFLKMNSEPEETEAESVSQFFHMMDSAAQPKGCCQLEDGSFETTIYTSCCNADRGIYYYTTYENRQITAVELRREDLDGSALVRYPLRRSQQIFRQT